MRRPVLNSTRIELRPITLRHLLLLHDLDSDHLVMEFILGRARTSQEIDEFWVPRCADRAGDQLGLGWRVGFEGDTFLGWWDLGLCRIWAETMAIDHASRGVMSKIGMRHVRTKVRKWQDPLPGADKGEVLYEITATQILASAGRTRAGRLMWTGNAVGSRPGVETFGSGSVRTGCREMLLQCAGTGRYRRGSRTRAVRALHRARPAR